MIGAIAAPGWTLTLWLVCGALVLGGALTFGELASRLPQSGGLYVYLRAAWGRRAAFLYGWQCLLVMDPGITAALALGMAPYVTVLFPAAAGREVWVAVATVWLLAILNMAGLKLSARVLNALTLAKVLALAGIVVAAFTVGSGSWDHFAPLFERQSGSPRVREALGLGLIGVFYSFGGFWEAARVSGEVRDTRRVLPRALMLGVAAVTVAYLATTAAFLYLVPPEGARIPAAFAAQAGAALFGARGPAILASIIVLSVVASAAALLLMAPRLYVAMSRDGLFPADLAEVHPRTGSPMLATGLLAGLATIYVVSGKFPQIVAFFMCPTLLLVALAAAGLFRLRHMDGAEAGTGRVEGEGIFRAPGFPVTPALFVLLLVAVAAVIVLARPFPALAGLALVAAGIPFSRLLDPAGPPKE